MKEVETDTEVTQKAEKVEKGEAVKALKSLVKNKYWVYTLMATLYLFLFSGVCGGMSPVMVPIFAMIADAAEYGRIKNGIRAEGMAFSAVGFAEKVGTGIGGVIMTSILAAGGFDAGLAVQPKRALTAIEACLNWAPWPVFAVTVVFLLLYNPDKILPELKKEEI